ncbi:MAG: hypothetical protein IJB63_03690 [Alistipes sp.]|nr:hypothetical protein [Alistipes sp.]
MKRQFREMEYQTKRLISSKLKGRKLSDQHKQAISNAMKAYWEQIPSKNNENNNQLNDEKSM